jgi:glucosamine--fructose-6-phosphate aminotransferase (isomerizing)
MCGIIGYTGNKNSVPYLIEGLKKLEYRGYDSAGVAVMNSSNRIEIVKKEGRISVLEKNISSLSGSCGIGHTRWATHGRPSDCNSHPHKSGKFVLVHNGIIENFLDLKIELVNSGTVFESQTDSEVIVHLLTREYNGDFIQTLIKVSKLLRGSYALAVICEDYPDCIAVAKKDNPLIIGLGKGENFIASDVLALAGHTDRAYVLSDGEFALVNKNGAEVYDCDGRAVNKKVTAINISENALGLGENESYMIKEIKEIPAAVKNTFEHYMNKGFDPMFSERLKKAKGITIVACGTAFHAGVCGKYVLEDLCRIPVNVEIASEFRYKKPLITSDDLVIAISQSGETADTLAALRLAKACSAPTAAITNVATSSITQIADFVLPMLAGPEVAVAATKSYNAQLVVLYMLAIHLGELKGLCRLSDYLDAIEKLPSLCSQIISKAAYLNEYAGRLSNVQNVFFLGRNLDYAVALEGSLKLKEISYIHSEGYPAGELKHGTLALIEKNSLVIVLITQNNILEKTMNALFEVKAREAYIIMVTQHEELARKGGDGIILLPETKDIFMPLLCVIPLQIFAYYMARARGNDPDKPRNLAKSVTVE